MSQVRADSTRIDVEQDVLAILEQIDSEGEGGHARWTDKRRNARRKLRAACRIRHHSPGYKSVVTTPGTTRELSVGGMSFLSPAHFLQKTPLGITIVLTDGKCWNFFGRVVYSRLVRERWYLTGVEFCPVDDDALTRSGEKETPPEPVPEPASKPAKVQGRASTRRSLGTRERALAFLSAAGASRVLRRDTIEKIVALSMSPDHVVRRATIPVLMQIPRSEAVMVLIQFLDDPNAVIQTDAVDGLGTLGAQESATRLRALLQDENTNLALHAAEALGELGDQNGLPLAVRVLYTNSPLNRRAARALGIILGQPFRPNAEGVAAARRYARARGIK